MKKNHSPLLVDGDGSRLFHATNAAHQAINDNTDIIPSPDLRLAAFTLARDFILSNSDLCTSEILLELEQSLQNHTTFFMNIFSNH